MNNSEFIKNKGNIYGESPNIYHPESVETQANLEDLHVEPHDPIDLKCSKLMQINQNLKYSLSVMETQLELLKRKQNEKNNETKKLKQKLKLKSDKEIQLKRHIKLQKQKAKKQIHGYHYIKKQLEELQKQQIAARQARLRAQQRKNQIYEEYQEAEQQYKKHIYQLKQLEGLDEGLEQVQQQNRVLREKLEDIEDFLNEKGDYHEHQQQRKAIVHKIKELNEKVYVLQKQQQKLVSQINNIHKQQKSRAKQKIVFEQKSSQISKMSKKIQQISTNVTSKKAQFAHLDSIYKQVCVQQNKLKKQYVIERQCLEEQRKYRENRLRSAVSYEQQNHKKLGQNEFNQYNFSKNTNRMMEQSREKQGQEISQLELMNIINRYEKIKNKN